MATLRNIFFTLTIASAFAGQAQEATLKAVSSSKARSNGVITKNDELAGYWSFYKVDREDSKNFSYGVSLLSTELKPAGEIKIVRGKNSYMMENTFNGNAFVFTFINGKNVELESYDVKGKKLGAVAYEDESKWERMRLSAAMQMGENGEVNQSVFPIGDGGFVKQGMTKGDKRGYEMVAYDNNLKELWRTQAALEGMIESLDILEVTDNFILGTVMKQKNAFDMPDNTFLALFDVHTGTKMWEKEITYQSHPMTVLNAFPFEGKNGILLNGEYFEENDNIVKSKSTGLYSMRIGMDGTPSQTELYSWDKDILQYAPEDEKGKKDLRRVFIHKVVSLPNGSITLIGEQYNKALSPTGGIQITTRDMFITELTPELKLKRIDVFPKATSRVAFPMEYASLSASMLALVVKQMGYFDYEFTTVDKEKGRYYSTFTDYDRGKNADGDKVGSYAGTIVGDGVDKPLLNKYDVKAKGATYYRVMRAKPGYIMVMKYMRKMKTLNFQLQQVDF
ncbi:MAG: DUF6770 family protein [Flavobacteriales bacterium]